MAASRNKRSGNPGSGGQAAKPPSSQLRIIGGQWRGRKLSFTPAEGLRPTPDRVRETLFNWLSAGIHGARCLDLFSGSGALGMEALSRGATWCDFVDSNGNNIRQISSHLDALEAGHRAACHPGSAGAFLAQTRLPYDIVFLDPPFGQGLVEASCKLLSAADLLAPGAQLYLESGSTEPELELPASWQLHRRKTAGEVSYCLYRLPTA